MHKRAELNGILISLETLTPGTAVACISAAAKDQRASAGTEASETINQVSQG